MKLLDYYHGVLLNILYIILLKQMNYFHLKRKISKKNLNINIHFKNIKLYRSITLILIIINN